MIMVDGDDQKMIKCFTFEKEEREKQKWAQGKGIKLGAIFGLAILLRGEFSWLIWL
jgi:hypothetical protein